MSRPLSWLVTLLVVAPLANQFHKLPAAQEPAARSAASANTGQVHDADVRKVHGRATASLELE